MTTVPVRRKKGKITGKEYSPSMTVEAVPLKRWNSLHSFLLSALPGVIIAIAATLWFRSSDGGVGVGRSSDSVEAPLIHPSPGSWTYGYYTTQSVSGEANPSTHALLYPNGGGGEPELVSFANREDFLKLGRLYNDLGQIVQSPSHFLNGTALYKGPEKPGTHFQWPAGEYMIEYKSLVHLTTKNQTPLRFIH